MPIDNADPEQTAAALAAALRALREFRHLRQVDVAVALDVSPRNYQDLEAGKGRFQLNQVAGFSEITDSDPMGLVAAVMLRSSTLAVRAAESKVMTSMVRLVDDFLNALGEHSDKLRPNDMVSVVRPVLIALAREIVGRHGGPPAPPPPPGA